MSLAESALDTLESGMLPPPEPGALDQVLTRLDYATWRVMRDEPLRPDELPTLLEATLALAPRLSATEQAQVRRRVETLTGAAEAARARLQERLDGIGAGRRAIHGYSGAVRATPTGRRLRQRA